MSDGNGKSSERRRFPRVSPAVDLLGYEGSAGVGHEQLTDISQGGLRLVTSAPEKPGSRVKLRLGMPDADPLEVSGQVVWARQAAPFHAGIRFVGLTDDLRAVLASLAPPTP